MKKGGENLMNIENNIKKNNKKLKKFGEGAGLKRSQGRVKGGGKLEGKGPNT